MIWNSDLIETLDEFDETFITQAVVTIGTPPETARKPRPDAREDFPNRDERPG